MEPSVWLASIISIPVAAAFLFVLSYMEEIVIGRVLTPWSRYSNAAWYCFSSFIGENLTKDSDSNRAWGVRWTDNHHVLLSWPP